MRPHSGVGPTPLSRIHAQQPARERSRSSGHLTLGAIAGCSSAARDEETSAAAARAAALAALSRDSGTFVRSAGVSDTTSIPDLNFLRRMVDHHQELIILARAVAVRPDASAGVREDARTLATAYAAEIDSMEAILERSLREHHTPVVAPAKLAVIDSVLAATGPALDRAFREAVIAQHRDGIAMIDQYLPRLSHSRLKLMVQRMHQAQARDTAELRQKIAAG